MAYIVNPEDGDRANSPRRIAPIDPNVPDPEPESMSFEHPGFIGVTNNMYIRIAVSGIPTCTFPNSCYGIQFSLKTWNGNPVTLSASEQPIFDDELDNVRVGPASITRNGCLFQIFVRDIGNVPSGWKIQILNNTGEPLEIVWVVADNVTDAAQRWLDVSSPQQLGQIPIGENDSDGLSLTIANRGTRQLEITGPESSGDFSFTIPVIIEPGSCKDMAVQFKGSMDQGTHEETVQIESDDSLAVSDPNTKHNKQVVLKVTCSNASTTLAAPTLRIAPDP